MSGKLSADIDANGLRRRQCQLKSVGFKLSSTATIAVIFGGSAPRESVCKILLILPIPARVHTEIPNISGRLAMHFSSQYHVYSIPSDLIQTLTPRNLVNQPPEAPPSEEPSSLPASTSSRVCNACLGVSFPDVDEQRTHYRSDWHRYNVKLKLNGGLPVSEADFAQLVDGVCHPAFLILTSTQLIVRQQSRTRSQDPPLRLTRAIRATPMP